MRAGRGQFARVAVIAVCLAVGAGPALQAQGRGGGGPGGGGPSGGGPGGGGPGGGGMGGPQFPVPGGVPGPGGPGMGVPGPVGGPPPQQRGPGPEGRPGLQLGPPGRWWDDRATVKSLRLSPEQRARMDAIFEQNRERLQARFEAVRQAEMQMEEAGAVGCARRGRSVCADRPRGPGAGRAGEGEYAPAAADPQGDGCGADQAAGEDALSFRG